MKIILIDAFYDGYIFRLSKLFGFLLQKKSETTRKANSSKNIERLIKVVDKPYVLDNPEINYTIENYSSIKKSATTIAKLYTILVLKSFLFVRLFSLIRIPIFNTTTEAILFYRKQFPGKQQELCLPRALFAASTSKSFKKESVVFIGVFLPSRAMHAWIIENNIQPDPFDDIWICYQPVAVIYNA